MTKFKTRAEYLAHVSQTAIRIVNNPRCDISDQLDAICPVDATDEQMSFASDVYNRILEEQERRARPSIARHL